MQLFFKRSTVPIVLMAADSDFQNKHLKKINQSRKGQRAVFVLHNYCELKKMLSSES